MTKDPYDPKMGGRVALVAMIVAFALVVLMIWIAG
jgi:hypothetical protein